MQICGCGKKKERERHCGSSLHVNKRNFGVRESKILCFLKNARGVLMPAEGSAALCRNQEHPEKLIKTLPSDYTPEDANRFLSRPSLTQLAPRNAKDGWDPPQQDSERKPAYQRADCPARAAAAGSTSTQRGQLLRNISKAQAAYRKGEKKVCLTTSLTGGLDKSGAHFKLLLWQKRGGFTDICAQNSPNPREHSYKEHTQSLGVFGKKVEHRCPLNITFAFAMCIINPSLRQRCSWELYIEFPRWLLPTRARKDNVFPLKLCYVLTLGKYIPFQYHAAPEQELILFTDMLFKMILSQYLSWAVLELGILLPQPPNCDCRHRPRHSVRVCAVGRDGVSQDKGLGNNSK